MINQLNTAISRPFFNQERTVLLNKVFKKTAIETAITAAIVSVTAVFIVSGSGIVLLAASAAAMILFNAGVRLIMAELIYRNTLNPTDNKKILIEALSYIAPITFSVISSNSADMLIHEAGHALAAKAVYENVHPAIAIEPFHDSHTYFNIDKLTEFGEAIGAKNSYLTAIAAGPGLSLGISAILLTSSYALDKKYPELSKYLFFTSLINIANHALYALSTIWASSAQVSKEITSFYIYGGGFPPLLICAGIIGIPIFIKLAFVAGYYIKESALRSDNRQAI